MDCLQKSGSYYRRQELMANLEIPMMSEINRQLGDLAEVFYEECPEPLKYDVGIDPKLTGPAGDLWVSPSDILVGKVVLKPPVTSRYIKALTHEGILEIGMNIEEKFKNEMRIEKEKALKAQEEYLNFLAERKLNNAIDNAIKEVTKLYEEKIRELMEEFETRLAYELNELEILLRNEFAETLKRKKMEWETTWKKKLEVCIIKTVQILTQKYLQTLQKKEQELTVHFQNQIIRERKRMEISLDIEEKHCRIRLEQVKHNLECKSIANMMYILCMERRKYKAEINAVENRYKEEILLLETSNKKRQKEIDELVARFKKIKTKLNLRDEILQEILRQFQKFINFALRATPTQAEFLLSVEKMMLFELNNTIESFDNKKEPEECQDYILDWKSTSSSAVDVNKQTIGAKDYHECLSQATSPESSKASNDFLPAFYYNNKMYVREDFRNMMSQNRTISRSNILWNKDVEHLMVILKNSVENVKLDPSADSSSLNSSLIMGKTNPSYQSYVHFDKKLKDETLKKATDMPTLPAGGASLLSAIDSKELINLQSKRVEQIQTVPSSERLGILAASDSLTMYKQTLENKSKTPCCAGQDESSSLYKMSLMPAPQEEIKFEENVLDIEDVEEECICSIDETKTSAKLSTSTQQSIQSETQKKDYSRQSKISLHVDSLELLKKQHRISKLSVRISLFSSSSEEKSTKPQKKEASPKILTDKYAIEDSPWKAYHKTSIKSEISRKPSVKKSKVAAVVGDKTPKEHFQKNKEFTVHRISSIMKILNKNPSLIKMFTGCTQ